MSRRIVVASANPHKASEIVEIMQAVFGDEVEMADRPSDLGDVDETGETLLDNARLKGHAVMQATGSTALADDTGLFVAALGGEPGVYSARYAGEDATYADNVEKLLSNLLGQSDRRAEFVSLALAVFPDGSELYCEGKIAGSIAASDRGTNGFGYDGVFIPDEGDGRTFAEMTAEEKHRISHRGRALRGLAERLRTASW